MLFNTNKLLDYCLAMCDEKDIDPNFVIKENDRIILKNFNSDLEILSAYKELSWELYTWTTNHNIRRSYGLNIPFKLDNESFVKKEFIINSDYLKEYSIKNQLQVALIEKGFNIVTDKSKADYVFIIENLGFGALDKIKKYIKAPTNLKSNDYFGGMGDIGVLAGKSHIAGGGTGSVGAGIAVGMMAVGLVFNLLDNSGDFIYTFNRVTILDKNNISKTVFINSPKVKGRGYIAISDKIIDEINKKAVNEYMNKSLKLVNLDNVQ